MRGLFLLTFLILLFSCSDDTGTGTTGGNDTTIIKSFLPSYLYIDTGQTDTLRIALSSTKPIYPANISAIVLTTTADTLLQGISIGNPLFTTVLEDTIGLPITVAQDCPVGKYWLKFTVTNEAGSAVRSLMLETKPVPDEVSIDSLTPSKDTLAPLEVDTFLIGITANDTLTSDDLLFRFFYPQGGSADSLFTITTLPFVPDTTILCTTVVQLLQKPVSQGLFPLQITARNGLAEELDSISIFIEADDSIALDSLLLEADSISPGGILEGEFLFQANKFMKKSEVSLFYLDAAQNPVSSISSHVHSFDSTFNGTVEFDIKVGSSTPLGNYTVGVVMTNDTVSDTLLGSFVVADSIVETLKLLSFSPHSFTLYRNFSSSKAKISIQSSKRLDSRNTSYSLFDTAMVDQKSGLKSVTETFVERLGVYEIDFEFSATSSIELGDYQLRYRCALDSVGDSITVPVTITDLEFSIGDIPNMILTKGESKTVVVDLVGGEALTLQDFSQEIQSTIAGKESAPVIQFISKSNTSLTFTVSAKSDAIGSSHDVWISGASSKSYFKVTIE